MSLFNELKRRNVIRVAAAYLVIGWLLTQVSSTLENALNLPDWFDSVIVSALLIGFPIAMLFAWAFELTPEGIKKEKDIQRDESITNITAKRLDYITVAAALGVAALFGWQQMNPPSNDVALVNTQTEVSDSLIDFETITQSVNKASIAVLPFADLSPNSDQGYFSDGIAEEILNVLVRIDSLKVASRTSAFGF